MFLNIIMNLLYFLKNLDPNLVWIIGSSIVRNAFVHARQSSVGINLGLARVGLQLLWQGYGGMTTCDVMVKIRNLIRVENSPGYLVLHIGGNDLGHVKVGFLRNRIKNIMRKIRALLPNTRIIWSEILPRNQWRYSQNHDAMNRARKRINSSIGAFVLKLGGYYVQYPDIALDVLFLKRDGVHLTDLGNEIFLNTLQGALESFVLSLSQ